MRSIEKLVRSSSLRIFLLAAVLRISEVLLSAHVYRAPLFFADNYLFHLDALNLLKGELSFTVTNLYCYILGTFYRTFGVDIQMFRIFQGIIGSFTCVLVYRTGKALWGKRAGAWAGALAGLAGPLIFYDTELLKPAFANFFFSAYIYALARSVRSREPLWLIATLPLLGLAAAFREHLPIVILAVPLAFVLSRASGSKKTLTAIAILLIALSPLLPAAPWGKSIRYNQLTAVGGIYFYIGNHAKANGTYAEIPGVPRTAAGHYDEGRIWAGKMAERPLSREEANQWWLSQGLDFIRTHPVQWLKLEGAKLFLALNAYEIPHDGDYPYRRMQSPFLKLPFLGFGLIFPLALAGFAVAAARRGGGILVPAIFALYLGGLLLTFVTGNFRLPLYIPACLGAGLALSALGDLRKASRQARIAVLAVTAGAFLFSNYPTYLPVKLYTEKMENRVRHFERLDTQAEKSAPQV